MYFSLPWEHFPGFDDKTNLQPHFFKDGMFGCRQSCLRFPTLHSADHSSVKTQSLWLESKRPSDLYF